MKFYYVYFTGLIFGYQRGGMRHEGYFLHSRKGEKRLALLRKIMSLEHDDLINLKNFFLKLIGVSDKDQLAINREFEELLFIFFVFEIK